jgi:hypothetical protein
MMDNLTFVVGFFTAYTIMILLSMRGFYKELLIGKTPEYPRITAWAIWIFSILWPIPAVLIIGAFILGLLSIPVKKIHKIMMEK